MTIHYQGHGVTLHHGDCLDVLRTLPDASVDSVVTDPPYGLGFMGREWDALPPGREWAEECLRVLKPGGHLLAFGGTRTWHRLACAVEDAGFEVRDSIAWLYGSGFPKSLDVSKAIDKRPGVSQHPAFAAHLAERRQSAGLSRADVSEHVVGTRTGACWNWEHHQFPEAKWWPALRDLLDLDEAKWGPIIAEAERQKIGVKAGNRLAVAPGQGEDRSAIDLDVTTHATPDAERWQGWGTALKPAFEPVVVARKPLTGTVAQSVLTHGTGALNIDGCRISMSNEDRAIVNNRSGAGFGTGDTVGANQGRAAGKFTSAPAGRWPANVVLDEEMARRLDEQSGERSAGGRPASAGITSEPGAANGTMGGAWSGVDRAEREVLDKGGASRFFYVAKADATERPRVNGTAHPTVKPLDLMRWLVRLVTPPGGVVLEPFAGSGTTVEACIIEGFQCIAIEREADYLPLIRQRIDRRRDPVEALRGQAADLGLFDLLGGEGA